MDNPLVIPPSLVFRRALVSRDTVGLQCAINNSNNNNHNIKFIFYIARFPFSAQSASHKKTR